MTDGRVIVDRFVVVAVMAERVAIVLSPSEMS